MKKIISLTISVLMIICLCSCNNSNTQSTDPDFVSGVEPNYIALAYCSNDVLNPYSAVTEFNQKLSFLLFDSLVEIDESFNSKLLLASNITQNGTRCEVTLKSALFSDGSQLTSSDVIYSFQLAKESGLYNTLSNAVTSVTGSDGSVVFNLSKNDPNFQNLLTFPIIKSGTGDLKTDNDLSLPPIGCGKYVPDLDNSKLVRNDNYHGVLPSSKQINLYNTPDYSTLKYAISTNKVSVWNDSFSGSSTTVINGGTVSYPSNNLVYIGVNLENEHLSKPQLRYALSAIISRDAICTNVFDDHAIGTSSIFNPSWGVTNNLVENITEAKNNIFIANLEEIGYNRLDSFGNRLNNKGNAITFKLIYCSDTNIKQVLANEIAAQLDSVGITIKLVGLSYSDYMTALNNRNFDLYLAETPISFNMDFSDLICDDGKLNFSKAPVVESLPEEDIDDSTAENEEESSDFTEIFTTLDGIISAYYNGNAELYEISNMFSLELPIIPLCYKNNITSYQNGVTNNWKYSPSNPYYNVADCNYN